MESELESRLAKLETENRGMREMIVLLLLTQGATDLFQQAEQVARTGLPTTAESFKHERRLSILQDQIAIISEAFNEVSGRLVNGLAEENPPDWLILASTLGKLPEELAEERKQAQERRGAS